MNTQLVGTLAEELNVKRVRIVVGETEHGTLTAEYDSAAGTFGHYLDGEDQGMAGWAEQLFEEWSLDGADPEHLA